MATVTSKALARTSAATSSTTLYTVPNTSTTTIVTNIAVANTSAVNAASFTITIDGVDLLSGVSLASSTTAFFDVKQVIPANATPKIIAGYASSTSVKFHISGVEIV